ncbi:DUF2586 family protein [Salmonella enterica subsp. enterica]|nr:DUF2586 family protein [Salmonella enterica subsp. enterica serovar Gbadago]
MTYPQTQVNQIDLAQGAVTETERYLLFIGLPPVGKVAGVAYLNTQTDFDAVFGEADCQIKSDVAAARDNAGQNWAAVVYFRDAENESLTDAIMKCQRFGSFEGVVICDDLTDWSTGKAQIATEISSTRQRIIAKHGRWCWFLVSVGGPVAVTWSEYATALTAWQEGIAADGVMLVPRTCANAVGVIAGRLCNRLVTIADSPARVKTGSIVSAGADMLDSENAAVTPDILQVLDAARYSVPVIYADFDGVYWNDGPLLAAEGGDYQSIRIMRIVDKVARQVRLLAIRHVGDRSLNSTPSSIEYHQMIFGKPLRTMAKSTTINGVSFPGEVYSPKEGDIVITWVDSTHVNIYIQARPTECPLVITINIMVDLSVQNEG